MNEIMNGQKNFKAFRGRTPRDNIKRQLLDGEKYCNTSDIIKITFLSIQNVHTNWKYKNKSGKWVKDVKRQFTETKCVLSISSNFERKFK